MPSNASKTGNKKHRSLAARIIGAIVITLLLFGVIVGSIGLREFTRALKKEYSESTYHMARTAAAEINGDRLGIYLEGAAKGDYAIVKRTLDEYCRNLNVSLIYVIVVDRSDYGRFVSVFNPVNNAVDDSSYVEWELGHKRDTTNDEYRRKYRAIYEEGSPYETVYRIHTTDGQHPHITTMVPVTGESGQVQGILCMQRPVRELTDATRPYLITVSVSTVLLGVLASYIAARYIRKHFVKPVEEISREAARFAEENTVGKPLGSISRISEISELASSIDTLETDMTSYIKGLTAATAERERISTELSLASSIQKGTIPGEVPAFPERNDLSILGSMTPARTVGGDFYNYMMIDDDHLAMWIGDVSGKGIPAALFMMSSNLMITERTRFGGSPAEILRQVNDSLCEHNEAEMFVTVWLGILELSTGRLTAANAGHEYPALMQHGCFELLKDKHGFVLGGMSGMKYKDYDIVLEPGAKVFVYSDGVPEAADGNGGMFGTERMLGALNAAKDGSPEEVLRSIGEALDGFTGEAEQFDDITMLCAEYAPAQRQAVKRG